MSADPRSGSHLWADGAPTVPLEASPRQRGPADVPGTNHTASVEGPRALPTRGAVVARNITKFVFILVMAAVCNYGFAAATYARNAGMFMLASVAIMGAVGMVASWVYPQARREILAQTQDALRYSPIVCAAVALMFRAATSFLGGPSDQGSIFLTITSNALPVTFFMSSFGWVVVFTTQQVRRRYLDRSNLDDQEALGLWTRQDGFQR